jgi:hypothetical protein
MATTKKPNSYDRLRKTQVALYLDEDQMVALKALSAKTRVPQQVYLREGLDLILKMYSKKVKL